MQPGGQPWRRTNLPPLPLPGELVGPLGRWLTCAGEERTAYWLCATMLRRDHDLKMRSWPALSMSAAIVPLGLFTGQLADPLVESGPTCVLTLAAIYLLAMPLPVIMHHMAFSREYPAAWLLAASPIADRVAFAEGMRKAASYRIVAPALVAISIVLAVCWRSAPGALLLAAVGWLVVLGGGYAAQLLVLRRLPFAAPAARGEAFGPIALPTAAVGAAATTLAGIHYAAMQTPWGWAVYVTGLAGAVLLLRVVAHRVVQRAFALEAPTP